VTPKKRAEQQKIKEKNTPGQSKEKIRTGPSKKGEESQIKYKKEMEMEVAVKTE